MKKAKITILVALCVILCLCVSACTTPHEHVYDQVGSNDTTHWNYCAEDNEKDENTVAAHTDANYDGKCDVCGHAVAVPFNFAVTGKDTEGKDVSLNGYSATLSNEAKTYTATIKDGKFVCKDTVADGTYTLSVSGAVVYKSATVTVANGKTSAVVLEAYGPVEAKIAIETIEGVPTLVVVGKIEGELAQAGCIKLHADGEYGSPKAKHHLYWNNVSERPDAYEFHAPLTDLAVEDTPWWWFHIYAYATANPTEDATPAGTADLTMGTIKYDYKVDYNGIRYTVQNNDNRDHLIIQPTVAPLYEITSISLDNTNGATLVVSGTVQSTVKHILLHADAKDVSYKGAEGTITNGAFTATFDLTQIPVDGTPWAWFHIWMSKDETFDESNKTQNDLKKESFIAKDVFVDWNGIRYTVQNNDQLVIQPTVPSKIEVSDVTVSTTDGLKLVVTGLVTQEVKCVVIRAKGNGSDLWYSEKATVENGKFTATFDVTQLKVDGTPWCYFHVFGFAEENPEAYTETEDNHINLPLGSLKYDDKIDFNGVRYEVIRPDWEGQLVIQPKPISE